MAEQGEAGDRPRKIARVSLEKLLKTKFKVSQVNNYDK
jgi:hypothetical protein